MLKVHGYGFTLTKGRSKQRKKMCSFKEILIVLLLALISAVAKAQELGGETSPFYINTAVFDVNPFNCVIRTTGTCPNEDIYYKMYTVKNKRGSVVDVRSSKSLHRSGFNPADQTIIIIHGFNGTESSEHMGYLRDAYLSRHYNVLAVDWYQLTQYPCYITALANTKLVAQCTAQMYAYLSHKGSHPKRITCVGHSLGAHICGMMANHLSTKQHKIIGLDPARPLVENSAPGTSRLTRDDADVVQVIQTNAGVLGQLSQSGSLNFCVNGGRDQPYCKGHSIRKSRCSHFLSVCYLANVVWHHKKVLGVPCPEGCLHLKKNRLPIYSRDILAYPRYLRSMQFGNDAPEDMTGTFCVQLDFAKHCPFTD